MPIVSHVKQIQRDRHENTVKRSLILRRLYVLRDGFTKGHVRREAKSNASEAFAFRIAFAFAFASTHVTHARHSQNVSKQNTVGVASLSTVYGRSGLPCIAIEQFR